MSGESCVAVVAQFTVAARLSPAVRAMTVSQVQTAETELDRYTTGELRDYLRRIDSRERYRPATATSLKPRYSSVNLYRSGKKCASDKPRFIPTWPLHITYINTLERLGEELGAKSWADT